MDQEIVARLKTRIASEKLDAIVAVSPENVTYVSGIVAGGASVKTAQELARHSSPTLTIGRYSHARLHDLQGALDALPSATPTLISRVVP